MARRNPLRRVAVVVALVALSVAGGTGCERNDMHNQPRYEPMEASTFFEDGQSNRPIIVGTVARGQLTSTDMRFGGLRPAGEAKPDTFPFEITKADLHRGKQRYEIYCGVCHGAAGDGDGMIVRRGFVKPPSLHEQRLKDIPVGHFYDVITNGWGAMYSYNDRVVPEDRWRIAAYIRVLQLSQDQVLTAAGPQQAPRMPIGGGGEPTSGARPETVEPSEQPQPQQPQPQPEQQPQPSQQPPAAEQPPAAPQQPPTPQPQPGAQQ